MSSNSSSASEEEEEEENFNELYNRTLEITRKGVEDDDVNSATQDIIESFTSFTHPMINFSEALNRVAYFYRYSTLNSAIARDRFLDVMNSCPELKNTIKESKLDIISLGGGPGTDVIGFLSALQDSVVNSNKTINLTIVDKWKEWASYYNLNEYFIREFDCGNVSQVFQSNDVCSTFMCVDLRMPATGKYSDDLKSANIVLLVRVLDILQREEQNIIIQNIVFGMKSGALLLLIDSDCEREIEGMRNICTREKEKFRLSFNQQVSFNSYPAIESKANIAVYVKKTERHDSGDVSKKKRKNFLE